MKKSLFFLLSLSALLMSSCGDSRNEDTSSAQSTEADTSRSAMVGSVQCNFSAVILTRAFFLPDAALDSEYYHAAPGNVYLIIYGTVRNTGNEPAGFQQPEFISESYRSYDQEVLMHYKGEKNDWLTAKLKPGETHRFISCFELPEKEARKGVLRFEKQFFSLSNDNEVIVPLPPLSGEKIKDNLTLPGVTDL